MIWVCCKLSSERCGWCSMWSNGMKKMVNNWADSKSIIEIMKIDHKDVDKKSVFQWRKMGVGQPPAGQGWSHESRWVPRHSRVHSPLWLRRCHFYFHSHPDVKKTEKKKYCCEKYDKTFISNILYILENTLIVGCLDDVLFRLKLIYCRSTKPEQRNINSSFYVCSHLYKSVLTVSIKAVPFGVKGLVVSISVNLTLPRTRLIFAVPLTLTTGTVR